MPHGFNAKMYVFIPFIIIGIFAVAGVSADEKSNNEARELAMEAQRALDKKGRYKFKREKTRIKKAAKKYKRAGELFVDIGNFNLAKDAFREAQRLYKKLNKNSNKYDYILNDILNFIIEINNEIANNSMERSDSHGENTFGECLAKARGYFEYGHYDKAHEYLREAAWKLVAIKDIQYSNLLHYYELYGKTLMYLNLFEDSLAIWKKAISVAEENNSPYNVKQFHLNCGICFIALRDSKKFEEWFAFFDETYKNEEYTLQQLKLLRDYKENFRDEIEFDHEKFDDWQGDILAGLNEEFLEDFFSQSSYSSSESSLYDRHGAYEDSDNLSSCSISESALYDGNFNHLQHLDREWNNLSSKDRQNFAQQNVGYN